MKEIELKKEENNGLAIDFSEMGLEIQKITENMQKMIEPLMINISEIVENINAMSAPFFEIMKEWVKVLEESKNDPDSMYNYWNYMNNMEKYFWVMPYNISTSKLKELIDNKLTEKDFDIEMLKYFDKKTVESMFNDVYILLPEQYRVIFMQIKKSFYRKEFALINGAIISIIEGVFLPLLKDKRNTKRENILEPIISDMLNDNSDQSLIILTMMVNNSLNKLYENISFNKVEIITHKKVRRHPSLHGIQFSNNKIESIMLLNLLYYCLHITKYFNSYNNSLVLKHDKLKNKFYYKIDEQDKDIKKKA